MISSDTQPKWDDGGAPTSQPFAVAASSKLRLSDEATEEPEMIEIADVEADDIVIAVVGPTGSGKSMFVCSSCGSDLNVIHHILMSSTGQVAAVKFKDKESRRRVILLDMPGFDDTFKPDFDISNMTLDYLVASNYKRILLSAILYLHRITDNRVAGMALKNLQVFRELCGENALDNVYLTTTMWDEVEASVGEQRLDVLKTEFWKSLISQGAQIARCRIDDGSPKRLVQQVVTLSTGSPRELGDEIDPIAAMGLSAGPRGRKNTPSLDIPQTRHLASDPASWTYLHSMSPPNNPASVPPGLIFDRNDIIIMVMGPTGAAKNSFVNNAVGSGRIEVEMSHTPKSQIRAVQPVRCSHPDGRREIVLVDTPPFDSTGLADFRVLGTVANWLKEMYQNDIKLTGILYLHPITDTPQKLFTAFKNLCGDGNMKNIVLITTMWDLLEDPSVGSKREEELLSKHWKDMVHLGSHACRFGGTYKSAWEIIDRLDSRQTCAPLRIQREMVDRHLPLEETAAVKALLRSPQERFKKRWARMRQWVRGTRSSTRLSSDNYRRHAASTSTIGSGFQSDSVLSTATYNTADTFSPTGSIFSGCSPHGRQEMFLETIQGLKIAYQVADISLLRGAIGIVLQIAQTIEGMGGAHHAICEAVEYSGWLLEEIFQRAESGVQSGTLSGDMKKTLAPFQRELKNLQSVVKRVSTRDTNSRLFLYDIDIQAIVGCAIAIRAIYNRPEVSLPVGILKVIARLEDQLTEVRNGFSPRQCECGRLITQAESQDGAGQVPVSQTP